jgi:hypothetical protein
MADVKIERDVIAGQSITKTPWQWRLVTAPGGYTADPHLNGGALGGVE